ncbi:hypothetical protein [Methylocella sp.]|uniref:hypothetical protein n=1 Tax=Methylocella sp. TaxID=1978226 RepID=UPI0035B17645
MLQTCLPTESELMDMARTALRARAIVASALPTIPASEYSHFLADREARRQRSLRHCHLPGAAERPRHTPPKDSGAFVPATAARIEDDRNLTDGARRCARKIMETAYRANRAGRSLEITVSYLARGMGRCGRTVQRYLRQLEREGYIQVHVMTGHRSRMCVGLVVRLLAPLFPRHHRQDWPEPPGNPGATRESQNKRYRHYRAAGSCEIAVGQWAGRCMDGIFRALMKTIPPVERPELLSG